MEKHCRSWDTNLVDQIHTLLEDYSKISLPECVAYSSEKEPWLLMINREPEAKLHNHRQSEVLMSSLAPKR